MPHKKMKSQTLPAIPEKQFFQTSEAALLCKVSVHTIRYWTDKFSKFIKPVEKEKWARKHYRYEDIQTLRMIKNLLYVDGFTIRGAIKRLNNRGKNYE